LSRLGVSTATSADAPAIAALHAASWQAHYRGAYSDEFLDGDVVADRIAVWTGRLSTPRADTITLVADTGGGIAGFAHTILDEDPRWGALLEDLHVAGAAHRRGFGRLRFVWTDPSVLIA